MKVTVDRAVLEQALEALEGFLDITKDSQGVKGYRLDGKIAEWDEFHEVDQADDAVTALRQALEAEQEESAYQRGYLDGLGRQCPNCKDYKDMYLRVRDELAAEQQKAANQEPVAVDGNTSDGYHTFNELYEFRKVYNAALFNEWAANGKCSVHKSWRHHDGELCFGGGWFIVVAVLPSGQISNHYEANDWGLFVVPETERALFEFDGHTGSDVVTRLKALNAPQRTWVGLTDEELRDALRTCPHDTVENLRVRWLYAKDFARAIEQALKEKNK
jgi:hypothetical protein